MPERIKGKDEASRRMRQTAAVSPVVTEARSLLLSPTVEAQLSPPERFKGELKGKVVELRKIGDVVAALRKVDNHYEATIYDRDGESTDISLDPSSRDIANHTTRSHVAVLPQGESTQACQPIREILDRMGYDDLFAEKLSQRWFAIAAKTFPPNDNGLHQLAQLKVNPLFISAGRWHLETGMSQSGLQEKFIFNAGEDAHIYIDPASSQFSKLSLSDKKYKVWEKTEHPLVNDMRLAHQALFFNLTDKEGKILASYSGSQPHVDPTDPNSLYFINTGRVYKLDLSGAADKSTQPVLEEQITIKDALELGIDPNGNFLIIRSGDARLTSLEIIDKDSGKSIKHFGGGEGPMHVDAEGNILYVDDNNRLRLIQTNFQAIPPGGNKAMLKKRAEELEEMQARFSKLELKKGRKASGGSISEEDVAATLRESIAREINEPLATAVDAQKIEDVLDRLQGFKSDPANQEFGEVVDEFIGPVRDRLSGIRTIELSDRISGFQQVLDGVHTVGDTIGLDVEYAKLLELRQKIDITDPRKRREIEQRLNTLQTRKDIISNEYQGQLIEAANQALPEIGRLIGELGSTRELTYFSASTQAQQFEIMLANIRDAGLRKELRDKYNTMKAGQRDALAEKGRLMDEQDRQRWSQVVQEAREDLDGLREQIEQLSDRREIDRFGRNPLVTAWRAKLFALPPELRGIEEQKLEMILGARKKDMEHRRRLGAVGEAGELKFGDVTFPVYKDPPRIWQPKFIPIKDVMPGFADLVFEDTQGRVFHPSPDHETVVIGDPKNESTRAVIERYRKQADEHFKGLKRKVPEFDEHWRITNYHLEKLEEIAQALNLQTANHQGILILQGEAGTGKNVVIDMLANLSNREVISILCNENTVKEDLSYEFYFDPKKGTYKLPSKLVEGIQGPGRIMLFDEISALRPGIVKITNPLFDYRRRLYSPEGGREREVITDPTDFFVGTMNPQNYAGTHKLSPEVKSRARVIDFGYPPFEMTESGTTRYRSDEAEMLAAYSDSLGEYSQPDFRQVWDHVINREANRVGETILGGSPGTETEVRKVYDVIRVANKLRAMYEAYQIGDSTEPMDFPTSLREVTDIVMEMNHRHDVEKIIQRVILPKIDDRRQRRLVEQSIRSVLAAPGQT